MAEFTHESTEDQEEEELQEEVLDFAPAALDDSLPEVEDPLQEINLGTEEDPRPTFISALLKEPIKGELIALLQEFRDCFAWHYHEMPGLDRELVEHKLPIKDGYLPVKHARRRIKTGAVRICVDYRNLNEASPKDEYPMPMADMLVDGAAHNQMLSFMDGNAGYNQIMVAEEDIHKTAFMCPGHIGAFEYTVMPFGLRNAGATYQRAMNSVFHDMIGHSLEVYIDDVVIKSPEEGNHISNLKRAFQRMRQHKLKMNPKKCVFGVQAGNFLGFLVHQRGIEIDKNKAKSIIEALPPRNKKELQKLGIQSVEILGDSMLVLKQVAGEYKCLSPSLAVYLVAARNLLTEFREATWEHIPREENFAANELAQLATGIQMPEDCVQRIIKVGKKTLPSVLTRGMEIDINSAIISEDDWRSPIITYLRYPTLPSEKRVRIMASNYLMWNEDLVRKSKDEVLLRCLGKKEYMKVMGETHEGICGAHQGGRKMCWLIRRYGYFWPTMMKDCIDYSKGCESCQRHGPIQQAPSVPMNPVVKPWPFRGWAMDLIGKIYPASNQQHCFIIVATDYFTKWVEAKPVKSTTSQEIITFIEEQIIQRFGIPESITTDRGSFFISGDMLDMAEAFKFKLLQSTPYYAQANGQAESSNKVIINIIRKILEKNPKQWHEKLSETLWAYRTSKREATGMTPYALTYGHDAILPMEIAVHSLRIAHQHDLVGENYSQAMLLELEGLDASRIDTLNKLLAGKQAVSRAYNKRVKNKSFEEGEIVWKAVLPLGTHVAGYGKWSPTWEGPFIINQILGMGAYRLQDRDGEIHAAPINGKWLKKFYPTMWDSQAIQTDPGIEMRLL
ncbi:unnamed protein product [Prunus brigantina]